MIKKIFLFLLIAFVVIQFFRPARNKNAADQPNYIGNTYATPDEVKSILAKACNDCHSNNTRYPWYSYIQPAAWWLNGHIRKGKKGLNFDEFTSRSLRFQYKRMDDLIEQVKEEEMPLNSYTWIHKNAILTDPEKTALVDWAKSIRARLETTWPKDSLVRRK